MKKILFLFVCILTVFFINFLKQDRKISFFEITDLSIDSKKVIYSINSKKKKIEYSKCKLNDKSRLIDLKNMIENNDQIKTNDNIYPINNLFIKSDYIILNFGNNELMYYLKKSGNIYDELDEFINNYKEIIKLIRKVSKEKIIIIINYDISKKYTDYLYNRLSNVEKNDCIILKNDDFDNFIKTLY